MAGESLVTARACSTRLADRRKARGVLYVELTDDSFMTFAPEWLSGNPNLDASNFMYKSVSHSKVIL